MPEPGAQLHHYEVEALVGVGGTSGVWSARDTRTGEPVALKLLRTSATLEDAAGERLLREARASRAVSHPAVVPVRDVFLHQGAPVLVMELLQGETLRQRFNREGRLTLGQAAALLLPIGEALVEAHRSGIAHRDLKPENIFLQLPSPDAERPAVRLLDFGVARFYEPPPGSDLVPITGLEVLLGTLSYMAPEQALRPAECDQRVDVWSFGVTLYEALAGCRPIEGESPQDTLRQLLLGGVVPLGVLVPDLPDNVCGLSSQLLVRNPAARAPDLQQAVEVLGRYLEHS